MTKYRTVLPLIAQDLLVNSVETSQVSETRSSFTQIILGSVNVIRVGLGLSNFNTKNCEKKIN